MNPGVKCQICYRTIAVNHRSVVCGTCGSSYHIKCGTILAKQHKVISTRNWIYAICAYIHICRLLAYQTIHFVICTTRMIIY